MIAGTGSLSYTKHLYQYARSLALTRYSFVGPVFGQDKIKLYQSSDLFVLPTYSENFGVVVAEALSNGCPAVVTQGAPWSQLNHFKAGWWINDSSKELTSSLSYAMSLPRAELDEFGLRGRAWMSTCFSWQMIAKRTLDSYSELLSFQTPDYSFCLSFILSRLTTYAVFNQKISPQSYWFYPFPRYSFEVKNYLRVVEMAAYSISLNHSAT